MENHIQNPTAYAGDTDSCCSTPFVSAPSSPTRAAHSGYYYSAPASPTHFFLISAPTLNPSAPSGDANSSFDFDFSATFPSAAAAAADSAPESMTSADELFFNGQIRPMKLSTHLNRPQLLSPLVESDDVIEDDGEKFPRGRDSKLRRAGSLRRRTRSMSPPRTAAKRESGDPESERETVKGDDENAEETTPRSSSSRRWVFLKEFLYRSKSEGRNNEGSRRFWGTLSFSPVKEKKSSAAPNAKEQSGGGEGKKVKRNGAGKRNPSPHEMHYTANRAQAEGMRRKTFLPYRQGLLGCLGFSSKGYGAVNGFARALNPVSSR